MKAKVCIGVPIQDRWYITNLIFRNLLNIIQQLPDYEIIPIVVGSEGEMSKSFTEKYGFNYFEYPNEQLDQKYDSIYQNAKAFNPDIVVVFGSDDIMRPEYFSYGFEKILEGNDMVGILDCYMIDVPADRAYYWPGYALHHRSVYNGVWQTRQGEALASGRILNRQLLDKLNWFPYGTNNYIGGCYFDDERFWSNITQNTNKIVKVKMADIPCSYYNVKSGRELSSMTSYRNANFQLIPYDKKIVDAYVEVLKKIELPGNTVDSTNITK